ncbi:MAG: hypothetical protein K0S67_31 [Nitrososphaeraceae archaeon]|jgi:hypothetical protein|nr:hypothetical protein [Nitrososphaeraceae archaeon]
MIDVDNHHEPRILIWFDVVKNKITSTDIPVKEKDFLEHEKCNHYYTVHFHKTSNLIYIKKHIRGSIVISYIDQFCCTPPRNKDDIIYVDCNGIRANIYG